HLTIISANGVVIRTQVKQISQAGRSTRGVRVMNLDAGDTVASVARFAAADLAQVEKVSENGKEIGSENGSGAEIAAPAEPESD
ncbi:MAG: hypothetical protein JXB38_09755, partial [Anaerolineales bacterium]|nr:hypothetical protein [Anaerolineales bacterium]